VRKLGLEHFISQHKRGRERKRLEKGRKGFEEKRIEEGEESWSKSEAYAWIFGIRGKGASLQT